MAAVASRNRRRVGIGGFYPAALALGRLAARDGFHRGRDRCRVVVGDALDGRTFGAEIDGCDTCVHLVGTPHPSPRNAALFRSVDLVSARESIAAAAAEAALRASRRNATILRPWYVLGPGHRWPLALIPANCVLERLRSTRDTARRLCLVTQAQMIDSLVWPSSTRRQGFG